MQISKDMILAMENASAKRQVVLNEEKYEKEFEECRK